MKKILQILLISAIVLVYITSKIQKIHKNSEIISRRINNTKVQTQVINDNNLGNSKVLIKIKDKEG